MIIFWFSLFIVVSLVWLGKKSQVIFLISLPLLLLSYISLLVNNRSLAETAAACFYSVNVAAYIYGLLREHRSRYKRDRSEKVRSR